MWPAVAPATGIFIHPNPKEPFGLAPLEAIATGMAVVAPDSGGILSYLDKENVWLTIPTAQAFAKAVQSVRSNPPLRRSRRREARKRALQYSWEKGIRLMVLTSTIIFAGFT